MSVNLTDLPGQFIPKPSPQEAPQAQHNPSNFKLDNPANLHGLTQDLMSVPPTVPEQPTSTLDSNQNGFFGVVNLNTGEKTVQSGRMFTKTGLSGQGTAPNPN